MSRITDRSHSLGPPQIELEGLQIWGHGRAYPNHNDHWDGNWLRVTAHCGRQGADVWTDGPIIHLTEIKGWYDGLVAMNETVSGEAKLGGSLEPNLCVAMKADRLGHIAIEVQITPDHMRQNHLFQFEIDQTYLSRLLNQCKAILTQYPIRNEPRVRR